MRYYTKDHNNIMFSQIKGYLYYIQALKRNNEEYEYLVIRVSKMIRELVENTKFYNELDKYSKSA